MAGSGWARSPEACQQCGPVDYHLPSHYFAKKEYFATAALVAASTAASPRCLSGHGCTWRGAVLQVVAGGAGCDTPYPLVEAGRVTLAIGECLVCGL